MSYSLILLMYFLFLSKSLQVTHTFDLRCVRNMNINLEKKLSNFKNYKKGCQTRLLMRKNRNTSSNENIEELMKSLWVDQKYSFSSSVNPYTTYNSNSFSKYEPKSDNQQKYVEYLNKPEVDLIFVLGPAGTGKTLFACIRAIQLLKSGDIKKVVITRPAVSVDEDIGFLPGNIAKKMDPFTRPIFDIFQEFYTKTEVDNMIYQNIIEISPLAYMRGRTFKNAFIIADEMQNSTPNQMMMLTTRLGTGSKMVVTGDLKQTDKPTENGLMDFLEKYKKYSKANSFSNIQLVELDKKDIERSKIVQSVIDMYEYDNSVKNEHMNKHIHRNNSTFTQYNINSDAALIPKKDWKELN
jgi:phosphate starvation-inducible protein PhoH and related proteins